MLDRVRDAFDVKALDTRDAKALVGALKESGTRAPSLVVVTRDAAIALSLRADFDAAKHPMHFSVYSVLTAITIGRMSPSYLIL